MAKKKESLFDRIVVILGKIFVNPLQYLLSFLGLFLIAGKVILTFIGGIVAILILIVALLVNQVFEVNITADIPKNSVVEINLAGVLSETPEENPLLKVLGKAEKTMPEVMDTLQLIKEDLDIQGVILRLDHSVLAPAQAEELRFMVHKVRKAGKKVLAYADDFEGSGQNAGIFRYYLACACDEIWMQPMGVLTIQGIVLEVPFIKKGLEKVGIKSLMRKRYEYKGAPDTFSEEKFTTPQRESMQALVGSFMSEIRKAIEQGRDLSAQHVKKLIDEAPWTDRDAKRHGLIDHIGHNDELINFFTEEGSKEKPKILSSEEYLKRRNFSGSTKELKKHVESATRLINNDHKQGDPVFFAIVYAEGDIIHDTKDERSFKNQMRIGGHAVAQSIREAAANPDVNAIIIRLDTGGGSPTGSELIRREVELARKTGKKVVISMAGMAASGGYWIATAADKIVAQPSTITGSIGVYSGKLLTIGFWENLGVFWDEVHEGENAGYESQTQEYSAQGKKQLDAQLDRIYEDFIRHVKEARKLNEDHVREIAKGRVWSGSDAHKFGLVDKLGGLETAVETALQELKMDVNTPVELIEYPKPKSFIDKLQSIWSLDLGGAFVTFSSLVKSMQEIFKGSSKSSGLFIHPPCALK